jgi:hypothetical protein
MTSKIPYKYGNCHTREKWLFPDQIQDDVGDDLSIYERIEFQVIRSIKNPTSSSEAMR